MTNWMTAAGIAFIAGGIATLICLRSILFGRAKRSEGRGKQPGTRGKQSRSRSNQPAGRSNQPPGRNNQPPGRNKQSPSRSKQSSGRGAQRAGSDTSPVGSDTQRERVRPTAERLRRSAPVERTPAIVDQRPEFPALADPALTATAAPDLPTAIGPAPRDWPPTPRQNRHGRHDDLPGGLASIGLADDESGLAPVPPIPLPDQGDLTKAGSDEPEPPAEELTSSHRAAPAEPATEPLVTLGDEESRPLSVRRVDRSDRAYGDRVADWIRPEYHDDPVEPSSGEYWTPVPLEGLGLDLPEDDPEPSARGYGWPTLVERLPAVPDYEPATGFDLAPVTTEPTELVPNWPPMPGDHLHLPQSWVSRDAKPSGNRFLENDARRAAPTADQRFRNPAAEPARRRPRPRPRPAIPDNVYVSRHAADPPH